MFKNSTTFKYIKLWAGYFLGLQLLLGFVSGMLFGAEIAQNPLFSVGLMFVIYIILFLKPFKDYNTLSTFKNKPSTYKDYRNIFLFVLLGILMQVATILVNITILPKTGETSSTIQTIQSLPLFLTVLFPVVLAPLVEELFFRVLSFQLLWGKKLYVLLSSFLFALMHLTTNTPFFVGVMFVEIFLMGVVLSLTYQKFNNVYYNIAIHVGYNLTAIALLLLTTK